MNKTLIKEFLIITFSVMLIFWGSAAILSQALNLTVNHPILRIMHLIGGFSPTIGSFVSLKRNNKIESFKEWIHKIFDIKHSISTYVLTFIFTAIYYLTNCLINGFEVGAPFFMAIILVPMMIAGGGNEEVGWRMILQPELEKKLGFHFATTLTALIWWIWHFPIFFIHGTANESMNFFLFGIMCLALSYSLAIIRRISNGVFPCILLHCLINGFSAVFLFKFSLIGCVVTLFITFVLSTTVLTISKHKRDFE